MIETIRRPKPHWLKVEPPSGKRFFKIKRDLKERNLFTICQSARCPNVAECWNNLNATFLIMGDICTRNCLFCSVENGPPDSLDCDEAGKILEVIELLESKYIVITSVTRDDLEDYGSSHFASIIKQLKKNSLDLKIEVLIPDFKGNIDFIEKVIKARPDVISHNLETVKNLYPEVNRNRNNYYVSLKVLRFSKKRGAITKSGIMIGLGETIEEIKMLFKDLKENGVDLLTIGQYLQPTSENIPVKKYYTPEEFRRLKRIAFSYGFIDVEASPLVRSSYHAEKMYRNVLLKMDKQG